MLFQEALARLGVDELTALLRHRPDALVEPAPRSLGQLAQRLGGVEAMSAALETCDRDTVRVTQAIALLGVDATVPAAAALLRSPETMVDQAFDELCARGLAWRDGEVLAQHGLLADRLTVPTSLYRPVAVIAGQAVVEDVRAAVEGLGGVACGLGNPELIAHLTELMTDPDTVARAVAGLPQRARDRLELLHHSYYMSSWAGRSEDQDEVLVRAGLCVRVHHRAEVAREVVVALWVNERVFTLTGPPQLKDAAPVAPDGARPGAEATLRGLTSLLDEACSGGVAALKKGGVGARERGRVAKRISASPTDVGLWIDLAAAAGLLAVSGSGYAPTAAYDRWRDSPPGARWATVTRAWWSLEFAPTHRDVGDGTEVPPPLPMGSGAGMLRRALLRAAAEGHSVRAVAADIDWFCPRHNYDEAGLAVRLATAIDEARALGVIVDDSVSDLGAQLVAGGDDLADRCAALLPEARCLVVLQSDLTATVSGQLSVAASQLLATAGVVESRGVAATWRFTPASVRAALDAGWTSDRLRDELRAISDRPLPQPLDYLIGDVARRHGTVRVRGMRSCIVGPEAELAEILHTRALEKLHLGAVGPTMLSSPFDIDQVLARLRDAGFAPLAEDAEGVVIVEERQEQRALDPTPMRVRSRVDAAELAGRLVDAPAESSPDPRPVRRRRC